MTVRPAWMKTGTGLAVDLAAPRLGEIDIDRDIAGPLSRIARFAGHRAEYFRGGPLSKDPAYTVAQHCVVGARAILAETGDPAAALAFLAHDAHEAFTNDLTTPLVEGLEIWLERLMRIAGGAAFAVAVRSAIGEGPIHAAVGALKGALDAEIFKQAGLPHPLPRRLAAIVGDMDVRMLDLERRMILGTRTRGATERALWGAVMDARPVRIVGCLRPWPQARARKEWLTLWAQLTHSTETVA